ncbi:MAG: efflux RND transporter periplasmic adaptor subunit [bacterium]|nr:efflux RND transporter periplasmic adaptor subunit [bacterium]
MRILRRSFTLVALLLLIAGCGGSAKEQGAAKSGSIKKVSVAAAEQRALRDVQKIMGTVEARSRAQIETKVQSRVERIAVVLGSRVEAGDVLAELDTRDITARYRQAQAVYEQAAQDLRRFETLLSQQAATQQEFDGIKMRVAVAEASKQEAEAMLSYARIVAPFSGVVTEKMIDRGDLAVPGRPLFTLEQDGTPRFVLTIPESNAGRISRGDSVQIEIPASDTTLTGIVTELSPSADPMTRSYQLKADLPSTSKLRPGQFGRLLLPTGEASALFVPSSAVVKRGQMELVYVAMSDGRVSLRMVRTGRVMSGWTEVLSGLNPGENVVTSGLSELSDGDQIERLP